MNISPPRARGPSLNAMRAFEAAARHGSFTIAANELCVTPGAMAQQVKPLEALSGARLFKRQGLAIATGAPLKMGSTLDKIIDSLANRGCGQ